MCGCVQGTCPGGCACGCRHTPVDTVMCSCGYEDGTFACKIRHIQINSGVAKAAKDVRDDKPFFKKVEK